MAAHRYSAADREVARKSDAAIARETAMKWLSRALACHRRAARERGQAACDWLVRARSMEDEALEHAAMVRDRGRTLRLVEDWIAREAPRRKPRRSR